MAEPIKSTNSNRRTKAAVVLAALIGFTGGWEGKRNDPYLDSVKVPTVCYGETAVEMKHYTDGECDVMFAKRLNQFAKAVQKSMPGVENRGYEWMAYTDTAYNVGVGRFNSSSMVRLYNQGDRAQACRYVRAYNKAGGVVLRGLKNRREGVDERVGAYEICITGVVIDYIGDLS